MTGVPRNDEIDMRTSIYGALTVETVIKALRELPQQAETDWGFTSVASYRGIYEELAGTPGKSTVAHMVDTLESAIGSTIHGYKGGEYEVRPTTGIWLAEWGDEGEPTTSAWLELVRREAQP